MIKINTIEDYEAEKAKGAEPLIDLFYDVDFDLRLMLQKEIFFGNVGHNVVRANDRFYHWIWENKQRYALDNYCEECCVPLYEYHSGHISHILPRSGYPEIAHDVRNANILCRRHHTQWEHFEKRKKMKIYPANLIVIETLKKEYHVRK